MTPGYGTSNQYQYLEGQPTHQQIPSCQGIVLPMKDSHLLVLQACFRSVAIKEPRSQSHKVVAVRKLKDILIALELSSRFCYMRMRLLVPFDLLLCDWAFGVHYWVHMRDRLFMSETKF